MKKIFTFLIIAVLAIFNSGVGAQNLIENWDGNGATGTGTGGNAFGWSNSTVTTWMDANAGSGIRYYDYDEIVRLSPYTYKGVKWNGRVLFTRWDGAAAINSVYAYPASLEANKTYMFTGKFVWHNNASVCNFTIGINSSSSGDLDKTLSLSTVTINDLADKMKLYDDTMYFTPATTGTYYLTVQNSAAVLGPVGDLSIVEVTTPAAEIVDYTGQYNGLTLGDISGGVTTDLIFTAGTNGVTIDWTSSNPSVISNTGVVTRPDKFDVQVVITATLSMTYNGQLYKSIKVFPVTVLALNPPISTELLAHWDFRSSSISLVGDTIKIGDISGNNLVGNLVNEAGIRTIGTTTKFNVLDLGSNKGYFNMGTEIGKAIYSLSDYTICAYFRVDTAYKQLNSNGNFLWTFSNAEDQPVSKNGYIIGTLKAQGQSITTNYYDNGNQALQVGTPAAQGAWHHMAYTQEGDSGKVYIDGVIVKKGIITNKPSSALPKLGLTGTPFNWLGRSCYPGDVYLRNSLVYGFRLLSVPISENDMVDYLGVTDTLVILNTAYAQDSNYVDPALVTEFNDLSLPDLSALITDIPSSAFITQGSTYADVKIFWKSSIPEIISSTGVVTRPNYYDANVTLTATLFKDGKTMVKTFPATVLVEPNSGFAGDLIVKYDFAPGSVVGATVTDAAEKHFTGTLMNEASIRTIGLAGNQFDVLDLGNNTGYFDMGVEMGKILYHVNDYTMGAYFLVDTGYTAISSAGNFLWSLSNSDKVGTDKNGYIYASLKDQAIQITSTDYNAAQTLANPTQIPLSDRIWRHIAYTQEGTTGVLYIDGIGTATLDITKTPATALPINGRLGTLYNWLGRSCYAGDAYLRKSLVYDFRFYKKALNSDEVESTVMSVTSTLQALNAAYMSNPNDPTVVKNTVKTSPYKVYSVNGQIRINGLMAKDRVNVWDVTGRRVQISNPSLIDVKSGIYIVKINSYTTKVAVW